MAGHFGRSRPQGLFDEEQVKTKLGPLFVASKRFGLQQADEVRQIDNMSESLFNAAYGSNYKLDLDGVDGISVLSRTLVEMTDAHRKVVIRMKDGGPKSGSLRSSFLVDDARRPYMGARWI